MRREKARNDGSQYKPYLSKEYGVPTIAYLCIYSRFVVHIYGIFVK